MGTVLDSSSVVETGAIKYMIPTTSEPIHLTNSSNSVAMRYNTIQRELKLELTPRVLYMWKAFS